MAVTRTLTPSIEERLTAAAFTILTDDYVHSPDAQRWAKNFLRSAARNRPTAFQQHLSPAGDERMPERRIAH